MSFYKSKISSPLVDYLLRESIYRENPKLITKSYELLKFINYILDRDVVFNNSLRFYEGGVVDESSIHCNSEKLLSINSQLFNGLSFERVSFGIHITNIPFIPSYYVGVKGDKRGVNETQLTKTVDIPWNQLVKIYGSKNKRFIKRSVFTLEKYQLIYIDDRHGKGWRNRRVCLTTLGYDVLNCEIQKYIYQLIYDKDQRRRNSKSKSRRGYNKIVYDDMILDNTKFIIDGVSNYEDLISMVSYLPYESQSSQYVTLEQSIRGSYKELEFHEKTGRIYSPLHRMNKGLTRSIEVRGKPYSASLDMRCCHLTLLGRFVSDLVSPGGGLTFDLMSEVRQWEGLFCDTQNHPRDVIRRQIETDYGYVFEDDQSMKDSLNYFINGSGSEGSRKCRRWLRENFPTIHRIWSSQSDVKQTGVKISKFYESKIFRGSTVEKLMFKYGLYIHIVDKHDEIVIFSKTRSKTDRFISEFKSEVNNSLGMDLPFDVEYRTDEVLVEEVV